MKLTKKQKGYLSIAGVILFLVITNPSVSAFRAYNGTQGLVTRPVNLFICSVYKHSTKDYIGLLGNFIPVYNSYHPQIVTVSYSDSVRMADSTRMMNDSSFHHDPFKEFGGHKINN